MSRFIRAISGLVFIEIKRSVFNRVGSEIHGITGIALWESVYRPAFGNTDEVVTWHLELKGDAFNRVVEWCEGAYQDRLIDRFSYAETNMVSYVIREKNEE